MAMVFSRDVLFLHVPKTGGVSTTRYLLDVLPHPVYAVSKAEYLAEGKPGLVRIEGKAHQTLAEARDFVIDYGFDLDRFPLILAAVRNPYDMVVSYYHYKKQPRTSFTLLDEAAAPPIPLATRPDAPRSPAAALVEALAPGKVARIEPTADESPGALRTELYRAAVGLGRPVEVWDRDGLLYVGPAVQRETRRAVLDLAQRADFREFVFGALRDRKRNRLTQLRDYYQVDGKTPPNLRIARLESLAGDVRAALKQAGIAGDAEFPWLNRSEHAASASYYDAETEAVVYEQARWLFDAGLYRRLELVPGASGD